MKWLIILCALLSVSFATSDNKLADCKCKEVKLYGKVRIVEVGETFRVRISNFPDLKVKITDFPDGCGRWRFVEVGEDFTIRFVESGEDFTIQFSDFPGISN